MYKQTKSNVYTRQPPQGAGMSHLVIAEFYVGPNKTRFFTGANLCYGYLSRKFAISLLAALLVTNYTVHQKAIYRCPQLDSIPKEFYSATRAVYFRNIRCNSIFPFTSLAFQVLFHVNYILTLSPN